MVISRVFRDRVVAGRTYVARACPISTGIGKIFALGHALRKTQLSGVGVNPLPAHDP
jgi:hypothetical protein